MGAMPTNAVALSSLLTAERKSLVRWVARIAGDLAAEDIAQSLFLRVQKVSDDPPIVNKRSFLFRLARNLAVDHVRAERRHGTLFEADMDARHVASGEPSAETLLLDREKMQILAVAIEGMPLRCREIFVLIKLHDLSVAEAAARLGISQDMVRKHIRHALQICHRSLNDPPA